MVTQLLWRGVPLARVPVRRAELRRVDTLGATASARRGSG